MSVDRLADGYVPQFDIDAKVGRQGELFCANIAAGCGWEYVGRSPNDAKKAFELHHLNYDRVGRERLDDVQVLCPECHAIEHDKFPKEVAA